MVPAYSDPYLHRINLEEIDRTRYEVSTRTHSILGEVVLVTPDKATVFKMPQSEKHLRSLVCWPDGTVISAGLPKFYNFKECLEDDKVTLEGIKEGHTEFTMKMDGSLIIRSIVILPSGERYVYWRTRGSHELGSFEEPVMRLIREEHPGLLDPNFGAEGESLLFEYCAPDNQIVVRYDRAKLWGIGYSFFQDGTLKCLLMTQPLAEVEPIPLFPKLHSPEAVQQALEGLNKEEGYVSWTYMPQHISYQLTKWKTAWYLKLHALRSEASPRFIKQYCLEHGLLTVDAFKSKLAEDGFDWEIVSYLEPSFQEAKLRIESFYTQRDVLDVAIDVRKIREMPTRKDQALACRALADEFKTFGDWAFHYAISVVSGKNDGAEELIHSRIMDMGVNEFRSLKMNMKAKKEKKA